MSVPDVRPASTREEWKARRRREWLLGVHTINDIAGLEPPDRHKAAAVALDGQRFGFTHDMLDAIEGVYSGCLNFSPGPDSAEEAADQESTYRLVEQAVANLRALLPPRETRAPRRCDMTRRGFTLVEVVLVVVLLGILVALAAPAMGGFVTRTNIDSVLNQLTGDINYARMLAVRSGRSSTLTISGTSYSITTTQPDGTARQAKRVNLQNEAPGFALSPSTALIFNSRGLLAPGNAVTLRAQGRGQIDSVMVLISGRPHGFY